MQKLFVFVMCQISFPQESHFYYGTSKAHCASIRNPMHCFQIIATSLFHCEFPTTMVTRFLHSKTLMYLHVRAEKLTLPFRHCQNCPHPIVHHLLQVPFLFLKKHLLNPATANLRFKHQDREEDT